MWCLWFDSSALNETMCTVGFVLHTCVKCGMWPNSLLYTKIFASIILLILWTKTIDTRQQDSFFGGSSMVAFVNSGSRAKPTWHLYIAVLFSWEVSPVRLQAGPI